MLDDVRDVVDESQAGYFAEVLKQLNKSEKSGQKQFRNSLFKHGGKPIYAARDEFGYPYVFIPLFDNEFVESRNLSKGLSVSETTIAVEGGTPSKYLELRCASLNADLVFGAICNSLCQTLVNKHVPTSQVLNEAISTINEWRALLSSLIPSEPSKSEIVGLFGELSALYLATKKYGIKAIDGWFGSDRTRHDFEFPELSLEVKASTSSSNNVTINGFNQLESSAGLPLKLARFSLDEALDAYTISDLLVLLKDLGYSNFALDEKLATFDDQIASKKPEWCLKHSFRINKVSVFTVDDDFPRLRTHDLKQSLVEKITSVEYKINLHGVEHVAINGGKLDDIAEHFEFVF